MQKFGVERCCSAHYWARVPKYQERYLILRIGSRGDKPERPWESLDAAAAAVAATAAAPAAVAFAAEEALGQLDQAALDRAIAGMLKNADINVSHAAVAALFKPDRYGFWLMPMSQVWFDRIGVATMAPHADYIVSMLSHKESENRSRALKLIEFAAGGMYTPTVLARLYSAVAIIMRTAKCTSLRDGAAIVITRLNAAHDCAALKAEFNYELCQ